MRGNGRERGPVLPGPMVPGANRAFARRHRIRAAFAYGTLDAKDLRMRFSPSTSVRCLISPLLVAGALVVGQLIAERAASAQVLEVVPPAVQIDVIPPRPSIWVPVPTYWGWHPVPRFACDGRWWWGRGGAHWSHEGRQWHPGRSHGHWRR